MKKKVEKYICYDRMLVISFDEKTSMNRILFQGYFYKSIKKGKLFS
jgi:hypothetical protein